mmetsp:Transcript_48651/g.121790  ORF Transcript_48651/g.121790 Transcript_48651/m.121790 type:complete len:99 (-) Transcript_48651:377-673(-)
MGCRRRGCGGRGGRCGFLVLRVSVGVVGVVASLARLSRRQRGGSWAAAQEQLLLERKLNQQQMTIQRLEERVGQLLSAQSAAGASGLLQTLTALIRGK